MEKITLTPGEWTRIHASYGFQVVGQHAVRIALGSYAYGSDTIPANEVPPTADAPYLKSQDYDPKLVRFEEFGFYNASLIYLMPDGSDPVDVVLR